MAKAPVDQKKEAKVKVVKDAQNGVTRPSAQTKTGQVWSIADKKSAELKAPAGRKFVIDTAVKAGINPSTAATQYGRWRKYNGLEGTGREAEKKAAPKKEAAADKK